MKLSDEQKNQYLYRSYTAADGLWFMLVEEDYGFEKALAIDNKVWAVMPKIQARFLKAALGVSEGIPALKACFTEKLLLDGCEFTIEDVPDVFTVRIAACPWHETMVKSGRGHLSPTIGKSICTTEYAGWAKEFGDTISCNFENRICAGGKECVLTFHQGNNQ